MTNLKVLGSRPYEFFFNSSPVNGIAPAPAVASASAPTIASIPAHAPPPSPVLADFFIRLHSGDSEFATSLFLNSWDEDHVRAMTIIGSLIYSKNPCGGRVLGGLIQALHQSHPEALAEVVTSLSQAKLVVHTLHKPQIFLDSNILYIFFPSHLSSSVYFLSFSFLSTSTILSPCLIHQKL